MAIDDRTIRAVLSMRLELERYVAAAHHDLAVAWSAAWTEVVDEVEAAARELADLAADAGEWPTRRAVLRAQRAQNALKLTTEAIQELARSSGATITGSLKTVLDSAVHWQGQIVATQLPQGTVTVAWDRVSGEALDAIVRRSTRRIEASLRPLPVDVQAKMKSVLIRGVAVGDNPNDTARRIVQRCNGAFDGGLARARTIARTETLDAHRDCARASRQANADTLKGWRWHCALSARTCPSCLALSGSLHDVDEPGPLDHPNGRCTAVPVAKTWRDLGIDLDEPEDEFPDARKWFADQPRDVQLQIMGAERLRQLNSGELTWDQMTQRRENPGWRTSYGVRPLAG